MQEGYVICDYRESTSFEGVVWTGSSILLTVSPQVMNPTHVKQRIFFLKFYLKLLIYSTEDNMFIIIKHKKVQSQDQQLKQLHFGEDQEVGHILEQQPHCILQRKTSISASVCLLVHWRTTTPLF